MTYVRSVLRKALVRSLVVIGMTVFVLILGAILLPLESGSAMPRDGVKGSASPH
jgi:hypothetical protein